MKSYTLFGILLNYDLDFRRNRQNYGCFIDVLFEWTIVVIDNAPIHRSKKFMAKIEQWRELDLWIYYLPPYSPELNIIETLWRFIKYQWMPYDAFLNFQNLKKRITELLSIVGSKYIIKFY